MNVILALFYCAIILAFRIPLEFLAHLLSMCFKNQRTQPTLSQRMLIVIFTTATSNLPIWLIRSLINGNLNHIFHGLYWESQRKRWVKKLDAKNEQDGWEGYLIADDAEHSEIGRDVDTVILYVHGGAFVSGTALTHLPMFINWIKKWKFNHGANTHILSLEYKLSPENPFPVARENTLACYQWLVDEKGISPSKIVFAGDSAGGNLAIVSAIHLVNQPYDYSVDPPSALLLISPLVSTLTTAESYRKNASYDILTTDWINKCVDAYLGDSNLLPSCPLISPLFENQLSGLPKVWICVGGYEVFLDDITLFVEKLMQKDVKAKLVIEDNNFHDYPIAKFISRDGAYENAIKHMGNFLFEENDF